MLPYVFDVPLGVLIVGMVFVRTPHNRTSTNGIMSGVASTRFTLDINKVETTAGGLTQVKVRLNLPLRRLEASWRAPGNNWSTPTEIVSW